VLGAWVDAGGNPLAFWRQALLIAGIATVAGQRRHVVARPPAHSRRTRRDEYIGARARNVWPI
jgi:hypothetical protein